MRVARRLFLATGSVLLLSLLLVVVAMAIPLPADCSDSGSRHLVMSLAEAALVVGVLLALVGFAGPVGGRLRFVVAALSTGVVFVVLAFAEGLQTAPGCPGPFS